MKANTFFFFLHAFQIHSYGFVHCHLDVRDKLYGTVNDCTAKAKPNSCPPLEPKQNNHHWSQHKSMFQQPPKHHKQRHDEQWLIASLVAKMAACRSFLPQTLSQTVAYKSLWVSSFSSTARGTALALPCRVLWWGWRSGCSSSRVIEDQGDKAARRAKGEARVGGRCGSCSAGSELGAPG